MKNGYRLQEDAEGHVQQVADVPVAATPTSDAPATAEAVATPTATTPAKTGKASGCAMGARGDGAASLVGAFGALGLLLLGRRIRKQSADRTA